MTVSLRCDCAFFLEKLAIIKCCLWLPESVARQTREVAPAAVAPAAFQFTTSQGGRQQIPTNIANICINSSLFCTPHPFLHTFILQFRITFPLCCSYIQCESLGIFCPLYIRTKELTAQSHQNWALFQYAPLCFYTYLPDYKIADCPIPCL